MSDVATPAIDALLAGGLRLTRYYGQPVCSPSRAAILTGRLPLAYGLQTYVIDPNGVDYGLNLNETTLPQLLRDRAGYDTHAVGKWHMGMSAWNQTPTFRGYNSFHGYFGGAQDYYEHTEGGGGYDLHLADRANCGAGCSVVDWASKGRYSTELYASAAAARIAAHNASAGPLFLYVAFQAVHSPDMVPQRYVDPYNATIADAKRRTYAGMLSALDEAVGNITAALDAAGMRGNTLIVFAADNGGPVHCQCSVCSDATGASNYPLRGGKHSLWEGGVRLAALASAPFLAQPRGANASGLMHHADWLPTLLEAAGVVDYVPAPGFELHGASQWPMLTAGAPSSRNESVCNIDPLQPAVDDLQLPGAGNAAIVTADGWKLQLGLTGAPWNWSPPNSSAENAVAAVAAAGGDTTSAAPAPSAGAVNCSAAAHVLATCLPGNDIVAGGEAAASAGACCALCSKRGHCVAWTFRASTALCYLKKKIAPRPTADPDCTSSTGPLPLRLWPLHNGTAQLFDLTADPWEREDVAAAHPEVVARLTARLAQWAARGVVPYWYNYSVDPASDPALRNGTWTPWR